MQPGQDRAWLYYRDLGVGLALGVTPYELFLGALARADDPHSGGRQLTAHLSTTRSASAASPARSARTCPTQWALRTPPRVKGEDSVAVCWFGDGAASEGGVHEAMNLAGVHKLPGRLSLREQRLGDQRPARSADADHVDGAASRGLRLRGRVRRRMRRRGGLRRHDGSDRSGPPQRGPDAHRHERASHRRPTRRRTTTRTATPTRSAKPRPATRSRACARG